jgi:hypothetical protein
MSLLVAEKIEMKIVAFAIITAGISIAVFIGLPCLLI